MSLRARKSLRALLLMLAYVLGLTGLLPALAQAGAGAGQSYPGWPSPAPAPAISASAAGATGVTWSLPIAPLPWSQIDITDTAGAQFPTAPADYSATTASGLGLTVEGVQAIAGGVQLTTTCGSGAGGLFCAQGLLGARSYSAAAALEITVTGVTNPATAGSDAATVDAALPSGTGYTFPMGAVSILNAYPGGSAQGGTLTPSSSAAGATGVSWAVPLPGRRWTGVTLTDTGGAVLPADPAAYIFNAGLLAKPLLVTAVTAVSGGVSLSLECNPGVVLGTASLCSGSGSFGSMTLTVAGVDNPTLTAGGALPPPDEVMLTASDPNVAGGVPVDLPIEPVTFTAPSGYTPPSTVIPPLAVHATPDSLGSPSTWTVEAIMPGTQNGTGGDVVLIADQAGAAFSSDASSYSLGVYASNGFTPVSTLTPVSVATAPGEAALTFAPGSLPLATGLYAYLSVPATNPASCADQVALAMPGYGASPPRSFSLSPGPGTLGCASLQVSPPVGDATATWTVGATTGAGGALAAGTGTITLAAPSGTVFPLLAADYSVNSQAVSAAPTQTAPDNVTLVVPAAVAAGAPLSVTADGVVNPPPGSEPADSFAIATSAEPTPTSPSSGVTFGVGVPQVTQVSASSPESSGGQTATWTVRFSDGDVASPPSGERITIDDQLGIRYSANAADYSVVSGGAAYIPTGVTAGAGSVVLSLPAGASLPPNATTTVVARNAVNPLPTNPATVSDAFQVATANDQLSAASPAELGPSGISFSIAPEIAGFTSATWTMTLPVPTTVPWKAGYTLMVGDSQGAVFPTDPADYTISEGSVSLGHPSGVAPQGGGETFLTLPPATTPPPQAQTTVAFTVAVQGVTNPTVSAADVVTMSMGDPALLVNLTTASQAYENQSYPFTFAPALAPGLALSFQAAPAAWTVGFTTSAAGQLVGGQALFLTDLAGAGFPDTPADYTLTPSGGAAFQPSTVAAAAGGQAILTLPRGVGIGPGTAVTLQVQGVTNPAAGGTAFDQVTLATLSAAAATPPFVTTPAPVSVTRSSSVAGAAGTTWSVGFTSAALGPGDTVSLRDGLQAGFSPSAADYSLTFPGGGTLVPQSVAAGPGSVTLTLPAAADIPAGSAVTLTAGNTTNPAATGQPDSLTVGGNRWPGSATSTPFTFQPGVSASASSTVSGAAGVTWRVAFPAEAALAAGDTITVAETLAGASFSADAADYTVSVSGGESFAPSAAAPGPYTASGTSGEQVVLTLPASASVAVGSQVAVEARGVTNPGSGSARVGVATTGAATSFAAAPIVFSPAPSGSVQPPSGQSGQVRIQSGAPVLPAATLPPQCVEPVDTTVSCAQFFFFVGSTASGTITGDYLISGLASPASLPGGTQAYVVDSPTVTLSMQQFSAIVRDGDNDSDSNSDPDGDAGLQGYSLKLAAWAVGPSGALTQLPGTSTTTSGSTTSTLTFTLPSVAAQVEFSAQVYCTGGYNPTCGDAATPVAYTQPIEIVQTPTAVEQVDVLPYKILYQPSGNSSSSFFSLTQGQTSQTSYSLTHSQSNTQTSSTDVGLSVEAGVSAAGWSGSVSNSSDWDQKSTQTSATSSADSHGVTITSAVDQQWKSFTGGSRLNTPGTQPWQYDEFVLLVHPQFAIWDNVSCPAGSVPDAGACAGAGGGSVTPGGQAMYALMGVRKSYLDVSAGQLLTCSQGQQLAIPGDYVPPLVLPPSECKSLLTLDPFAAAASQADAPSQQLGGLATEIQSFAAGAPGLGTPGSYAITLTQSQAAQASTSATSSFSAGVDSVFTDKAAVKVGYSGGLGSLVKVSASATGSYTTSSGQSVTQGVSVAQSQTSSSTVSQAAGATLADTSNPIVSNIWLDGRWDTLMFQVPASQVFSVDPPSSSSDMQVSIQGTGFWTGPAGVEFCPTGGGACQQASGVSVPSNDTIEATVPTLPAGTYEVHVLTPAGPSTPYCASGGSGCDRFTVVPALNSSGPTVGSVSPSTGPDGGGTVVTLTGGQLAGTTAVWFGVSSPSQNPGLLQSFLTSGTPGAPPYAPAPAYRVVSGSEIVACAPAVSGPETVWVSVYGSAGWSPVTPGSEFQYTAGPSAGSCSPSSLAGPPAVSAVSPDVGPATGGTPVTISGAGFAATRVPAACTGAGCPAGGTVTLLLPPQVEFCVLSGSPCIAATDVQLVNATTVTAQAPPGIGTLDVRVGNSAGFSAASAGDRFTYQQASSCAGCTNPGSVALGATPPVAASGPGSATIVATVLNGADLPVADAAVAFSTSFGRLSVAQAVYTDAAGVAEDTLSSPLPGLATVTAVVYGAPDLENQTAVSFLPLPVVTGLSVSEGPAAGGTPVTIEGSGFTGATGVDFGLNPATGVSVVGDGEITATAPPGFGEVDVRVINAAVESGRSSADLFTYAGTVSGSSGSSGQALQAPVVTGVSPAGGPTPGGTRVTVTGLNFTGATAVDFGPNPGTGLTVSGDGSLGVTAPAGSGTVDVRVVGRGGTSATGPADVYSYLPVPAVTGLSPASGPLAGGTTVTVGGTGFTTATAVDFGGVAATGVTVVSDDKLTAVAPAGGAAGPVDVTVTAACGSSSTAAATACGSSTASLADQFAYLPPPTVSGVNPVNGATAGGQQVTIDGSGFTTATAVRFGSLPASGFTVVSDGEITAVEPAGSAGTVDVTVTTACATAQTVNASSCGTSATGAADRFTFGTPPAVTGIAPAGGPAAGGTQVTLTGTGFTTASAVDFGDVPAAAFQVVSDSEIRATTAAAPAGAVSVTVTTACGTASASGATSCGTSATSGAARFTFLPLPAVTGVSPPHGSTAGGTAVTISGSGFTTAGGVDFGGVAAASFTVVSDAEISATVPAAASSAGGAVDVTVTAACATAATGSATACGTSPVVPADQFLYYPASAQVVTRTLQPGWNTLSIPFPLAQGDRSLAEILGGANPSPVVVAYGYQEGHWRLFNPYDPDVLQQPMTGLYLLIGGSSPVTATLIPQGAPASGGSTPPSPDTPPTYALHQGWNLVGPSASLGSESYSDFLAGVASGSVPLLIDPNGADVPVTQPGGDTADTVRNGYAYWVYASQGGQSLVGQVLTGSAAAGSGGVGGRGH